MLYGPNTNGGEIIFVLERGAEYAVRAIKKMIRRRSTAIDVKRSWYLRYNRWLQSKLEGTSWTMSRNYFTSESGRVVTQWPFGALFYGLLTKALGPFSERTRSIEGAGPRKRSAPGNMKHRLRPMPDASND